MVVEIAVRGRRSRRGLSALFTACCVVVTLLALGFVLPSGLGYQRYVITGTSMTGTIDLGSVAFERVVPVGDLRVGDVITYLPPADSGVDHLVTHRIVEIHGRTFRTQGDAVPQPDPWKFQLDSASQPRVSFSVPYVGYVFIALADRSTRMLLIGGPSGVIALLSLLQVIAVLRRRPGAPAAVVPVDESVDEPVASDRPVPVRVGG